MEQGSDCMSLSDMYRKLLHEREDTKDDLDEDPESMWLAGYAQGVDACIQIVRDHLLAEDTEDI